MFINMTFFFLYGYFQNIVLNDPTFLPTQTPSNFPTYHPTSITSDFKLNHGCAFNKITKSKCSKFDDSEFDYEIPESIDWREKGAVTSIKNQGSCGSCWSFSSTGAIEGEYAIKTGNLVNLSEQELIDCIRFEGCNGGEMEDAFLYVKENMLCTDSEIPYEAVDDKCGGCNDGIKIDDCVEVPSGNETALKMAVSRGPVSVAIEADTYTFQLYTGGILDSNKCGTNLDHGVLVVGYGDEDGIPYWIIKNSWGTTWGENGYVRIKRSISGELNDGVCGIALQASYPVIYN